MLDFKNTENILLRIFKQWRTEIFQVVIHSPLPLVLIIVMIGTALKYYGFLFRVTKCNYLKSYVLWGVTKKLGFIY